jgi:hypothetical protein
VWSALREGKQIGVLGRCWVRDRLCRSRCQSNWQAEVLPLTLDGHLPSGLLSCAPVSPVSKACNGGELSSNNVAEAAHHAYPRRCAMLPRVLPVAPLHGVTNVALIITDRVLRTAPNTPTRAGPTFGHGDLLPAHPSTAPRSSTAAATSTVLDCDLDLRLHFEAGVRRHKADERTRSKWSRVLRYAAEYKDLDEPLRDFIKRKGGINECAARYAHRPGRS